MYSAHSGVCVRKNRFFYVCLAVALILFTGLRIYYNDTLTYRNGYELLVVNESFWSSFDWSLGSNPGFNLTNALMKRLGFSTQSHLLFYAIITVSSFVWFIRKYSCRPSISTFLFLTVGCLSYVIAAMKQGVAIAIALLALDFYLSKKNIRALLLVLLASTFHPYALMYLLIPFLKFAPWTGKSYILLVAFAFAGILLDSLLGTIVDITTMIGEEFQVETLEGDGVNPFRLAVLAAPVFLTFLARKNIYLTKNKTDYVMVNLTILNTEIMFVALFGNPIYFGRLANYFLIFQTITLPYVLQFFEKKSRFFIYTVAIPCYLFFFWYENHSIFDLHFARITLWQYLQTIF